MAQILLDQNAPVGFGDLGAHDVRAVYQVGWAGLLKGDLLGQAAKARIDVFVTCDQTIPFQHNLTYRQVAVVVFATN